VAKQIVGRGVAQTVRGALLQPVYHTSTVFADGTVEVAENVAYKSWQDATAAARGMVEGTDAVYMIADQVKAFQKRLAKAGGTK
jgi:hypothetical protein